MLKELLNLILDFDYIFDYDIANQIVEFTLLD